MKVTLFGMAGAGTTTTGRMIAHELGLKFIATGDMFRKMAEHRGIPLYEFERMALMNNDIDGELDEMIARVGKRSDNFLMDSRLAWHIIPDSIKVKLKCDDRVRFERVANRDMIPFDEARSLTHDREDALRKRCHKHYGIKWLGNDPDFHFVFDTTTAPQELIVNLCVDFVGSRAKLLCAS